MPFFNLSSAFTKPSPLKAAILQIRLTPLIEASMIAIKIWMTPNFVAQCHKVGKVKLMDIMMFWRFIYFATVFKPAYLVILQPGNVAMNEC